MKKPLDVLVLESHPRAGALASRDLEAAGHRVHRCYEPDDTGFPCVGVTDPAACPLGAGIDVALVVRGRAAQEPTTLESGATCALRGGVPLVEDGPGSGTPDPYDRWLTARSTGDVVAACEDASSAAFAPLRDDIFARIDRLLDAAGVDPATIRCDFEADGPRLNILLSGPNVGRHVEQAMSVRVMDALLSFRRTYGQVNVSYRVRDDELVR